MVNEKAENMLWVEKYRPQTIEDCILPNDIKDYFKKQRDSGNVQNMLLSGSHGVGKTTIARALCNELKADYMYLNCSKDNGIDEVRTRIDRFSTSVSLVGGQKVVLGDEFDYFSIQGQNSLRGVIEQVHKNCRFIFTCNYPNRISDPIKSRLVNINFKIPNAAKPEMAKQFMDRCITILESENIEFSKKGLAYVIQKCYPDFRKTLEELQRLAMTVGTIDVGLLDAANTDMQNYIKHLKAKDYNAARKWIGETHVDIGDFFGELFKDVKTVFHKDSLGQAILILNEYQYKSAFVIDHELNLSALTIELMSQCKFNS